MIFSRIHHVAIICSNYELSKKFYVDLLGFTVIHEHFRKSRESYKLDLQMGNIQLELFSFPSPPNRLTTPESTGLRHLAFETENIEEAKLRLMKKNITCEDIRTDEFTGKRFTFFRDPDGLPIELYEK